jgi:hypothetical protein
MSSIQEIQERVLTLTKLKPKADESAEDFTKRVIKKVNILADADAQNWEELGEDAQAWVNKNVNAEENEQELDCLELPEDEPEAEPEEAAADDEAEGEQENEVERKSVKKASNGKAKKEVKAKAAKPAKKASEAGAGRGRKGAFPLDAKVKVLAEENPKRKGSEAAKRFNKYETGKTVADLLKKGVQWGDLRWDQKHGHISID